MSVVDLSEEREKRAVQPSEALAQAISNLDRQIALLEEAGDADSILLSSKLLKEKATAIRKMVLAQKQEERDAAKALQSALPSSVVDEQVKADIRAWLKANEYYYTHADATYWLYTPGERDPWSPCPRSSLVNHDPRLDGKSPYFDLFTEVLHEDGKWFRKHARTFAKVPAHTLNLLRWNFLEPVAPAEGESHSWVFDALMYSLSGGKPENVEHIEKVLVAKYLNPANYILPTIVISDGGGTGKSLFAEKLLPVIFGRDLVASNVSMDEMTGQFNGHLQGKAVWFINENRADGNDNDAIKRVLGSPTLRSERKGKDAVLTDNTALVFVAGNFSLGAIKLSGTETDRRFSILNATSPLKAYVAEIKGVSEKEAEEWMWSTGQHIVNNPAEVAIWLHHLINKHGKVTHVLALHGQDYADIVEAQAPTNEQVYRAFFESWAWTNHGYFKQGTMFNFYTDYAKRQSFKPMSNQRFYAEAESWLKRKGIAFERLATMKWNGSTASVFWNPAVGPAPKTVAGNDERFFSKDPATQRIAWVVEID